MKQAERYRSLDREDGQVEKNKKRGKISRVINTEQSSKNGVILEGWEGAAQKAGKKTEHRTIFFGRVFRKGL